MLSLLFICNIYISLPVINSMSHKRTKTITCSLPVTHELYLMYIDYTRVAGDLFSGSFILYSMYVTLNPISGFLLRNKVL